MMSKMMMRMTAASEMYMASLYPLSASSYVGTPPGNCTLIAGVKARKSPVDVEEHGGPDGTRTRDFRLDKPTL